MKFYKSYFSLPNCIVKLPSIRMAGDLPLQLFLIFVVYRALNDTVLVSVHVINGKSSVLVTKSVGRSCVNAEHPSL